MKVADVRAMTLDQLDDEVLKLKKEQFNLRFQRASGQLENTARFRVVRRDIARIMTVLKQNGGKSSAPKAAAATKKSTTAAKKSAPATKKPAKRAAKKK